MGNSWPQAMGQKKANNQQNTTSLVFQITPYNLAATMADFMGKLQV